MKSEALGVVVVRLQVPELHAGHRYLLNSVTAIHRNVLAVIGETEARLTLTDPLTFEMRAEMLRASYPNIQIVSLQDQPDDVAWSKALDRKIGEVMYLNSKMSPYPILYGGRDSFLQHYHGNFRTFELPPIEPVSGTAIRDAVEVKHSEDFRLGMIYASKHRFPISYQCVDVAIYRPGPRQCPAAAEWLFGQKKSDDGKWRFVGGFVSPQDATLEAAAKREVREETGVEPGEPEYLMSMQVDDHRYPEGGADRLMTALFVMPVTFGCGVAGDDIDACQWMTLEEAAGNIVPQHGQMFDHLVRWAAQFKKGKTD